MLRRRRDSRSRLPQPLLRSVLVGLLALLAFPTTGVAQELVRHGEVVQRRGRTIEVNVKSLYAVPEDATGTVFTRNTVGNVEQVVRVARIDVETATDAVVTGRLTDQTARISPQPGFGVSFTPVRRSMAAFPGRGLLRVITVPEGAEVTALPIRSTATGRTISRAPRSLGTTPVADSLLPGRYRLTIRKGGYQRARRVLLLRSGSVAADTIRLRQERGIAR